MLPDKVEKLNAFLKFNEREILNDNGKISQEIANQLAIKEFEKYSINQDLIYESDFDKLNRRINGKKRI